MIKSIRIKKQILLGLFLTIGLSTINAQVPQHIADSLQHILEIYQGGNQIPGISAAVNIHGVGTWTGSSGESFENTPLTSEMLLGIASNTKTFTATMVLKLVESGILSLNDKLYQWLPSYNNIDSNITIKQLLRHNSGIADFWTPNWVNIVFANPDSVWTPEDVLNFVGPPLFPAGTSVAYSNTNFTLAGMIMEAATGYTYPTLIRDSIIEPLNLDNTFLDGFEIITGVSAHPWHLGEDVDSISRIGITTAAYAGGCIKSTPQDMVIWYDHLFNQSFLSEGGFSELTDFINTTGSVSGIGCGIFRINYNSKTYYMHDGYIRGYSSYTLYDVADKHSISVIRNDTFIGCENVAKALAKALNVLIITEVEEPQDNIQVAIYPSPVLDYVTIKFNQYLHGNCHVQILNMAGQSVYQNNIDHSSKHDEIFMGNFSPGIYLLKLNYEDYSITQKIIKK